MKKFTLWDMLGLSVVLTFSALLTFQIMSGPTQVDDPTTQLTDPSSDIQLGDEWLGLFF